MRYDVIFEDSAVEDLSDILLYEARILSSYERARERVDALMESIADELTYLPSRNPVKAYGFLSAMRRTCTMGKYAAFYWVNDADATVHIDKVAHAKSDFGRFHFGD